MDMTNPIQQAHAAETAEAATRDEVSWQAQVDGAKAHVYLTFQQADFWKAKAQAHRAYALTTLAGGLAGIVVGVRRLWLKP